MLETKSFVFRFGDLEVREREFCLIKSGEVIPVEPKAFRVLMILLRNPKKLIAKDELLRAVWGDTAVTENSLARSIALLRRLLGDETRNPRYIETVATIGYRFLCPVEVVEEPDQNSIPGEGSPGKSDSAAAAQPNGAELARTAPAGRRKWVLAGSAVALLAAGSGLWYLSRPSDTLHISSYTQLTHDGRHKEAHGTDGSRLYIDFSSPNSLAQVGVSGGEMAPLPTTVPGSQLGILDVSPDGADLLLFSDPADSEARALWSERLLGGSTRRLTEGESGAFSPDGKSVVCRKENGDVYIVSADGAESRLLASLGSTTRSVNWSPDGKVIRFQRDGRLWEMSSSGDTPHPLLPHWQVPGYQIKGRWSSDGKFYYFILTTVEHEFSGGQIWAIDERRRLPWQQAAQPVQLTNGPTLWHALLPGKDGKTLFATGQTRRGELSRFDQKTGALTPFLDGISAEFVSFSRDGKFVAYVSYPDGILWRANRDGSNRVQLSSPPLYPVVPQWSPDGSQIVFSDGHDYPRLALYLVPADGGTNPRELLPEGHGFDTDPGWSSDGKSIVFAERSPTANSEDLRILDLSTHRVSVIPGSTGMYSSRWSPDGKYIAALAREGPFLRIFDVAAQRWFTVPTIGLVAYPCFSSDSRTIYFLRIGLNQAIFRIRILGGREERVADLKNIHLTGLTFLSLSLDPTDAPLTLRDIGTDDVYALALERTRN